MEMEDDPVTVYQLIIAAHEAAMFDAVKITEAPMGALIHIHIPGCDDVFFLTDQQVGRLYDLLECFWAPAEGMN